MTETKDNVAEAQSMAEGWIEAGMAPADAVDILVMAANRIIDQNNLEYGHLRAGKT